MKRNVAKKVARRKRRVLKRLQRARERRFIRGLDSTTVIGARTITYEMSERVHAIGHGGIGMMVKLARQTTLVSEVDRRLHLLKMHSPYQESDHVMAHVLNMMCGGTRLEHLELLRNNEALLNAVGADSIPDPTTAGDFCRQGQRTLSRWHAKDFEKEVPAPSTFSAFHCKAGLQRVLLEQRQSEPSDPAFVLRSTAMTSS